MLALLLLACEVAPALVEPPLDSLADTQDSAATARMIEN